MHDWMLSEEAWTKSKNWARRLFLLVIFSNLISAVAAGLSSLLLFRLGCSDLQRHYLRTYLWAQASAVVREEACLSEHPLFN